MKLSAILFLFVIWMERAVSADKPALHATRAGTIPKIDGDLNDECWKTVSPVPMTVTFTPEYGKPPSEKSEVRIIYDNFAIYVGAYLYDDHPDQIKHQLAQRDDPNALADNFIVGLDTYHDGLNGYRFQVSAAGVQYDEKGSPSNQHDANWDAVWESDVSITTDGWMCEIKIPYSAIRFPSAPLQDWGLQFGRNIMRLGELDLWSPVDPKIAGIINQWGVLTGLENITPPLRLSLSPYFTAGFQVSPINDNPIEYSTDNRPLPNLYNSFDS